LECGGLRRFGFFLDSILECGGLRRFGFLLDSVLECGGLHHFPLLFVFFGIVPSGSSMVQPSKKNPKRRRPPHSKTESKKEWKAAKTAALQKKEKPDWGRHDR
jgi:hypothetical protein